ncbi:MAG: PilZ domain-containing protein [Tepidisphaeraceae bacterium]
MLVLASVVGTVAKHAGQRQMAARRRADVRYATGMNVRFVTTPPQHTGLPAAGSVSSPAHLTDLSHSGAGMLTLCSLTRGENIWICLQNFGFDGLWVPARVMHATQLLGPVHRIGVCFRFE